MCTFLSFLRLQIELTAGAPFNYSSSFLPHPSLPILSQITLFPAQQTLDQRHCFIVRAHLPRVTESATDLKEVR
ncbi:hypothetical protein IWX92DRAFT_104623 [Phyllosticta citricarpa]